MQWLLDKYQLTPISLSRTETANGFMQRLSGREKQVRAHIGPSNACPRAAPETTVKEIAPTKSLSLSLSLSLKGGYLGDIILGLTHQYDLGKMV